MDRFRRNRERDSRNIKALAGLGWRVVMVWECELKDMRKLQLKLAGLFSEAQDE